MEMQAVAFWRTAQSGYPPAFVKTPSQLIGNSIYQLTSFRFSILTNMWRNANIT